ncbi:MAG: DUF4230 domain-containing protein, partial [Aristaeellaceae bacterium]
DLSGAAVTASTTLARNLQQSARLETTVAEEDGVLESATDALFLGQVQKVTVRYTYRASLGIDLSKVQVKLAGNRITLLLPDMEVLSDSLTPEEISKDDFWYPLTEKRLQKHLNQEQERCRAYYLEEYAHSDQAWADAVAALEGTVSQWIALGNDKITIDYAPQTQAGDF